MLRTNTKLHQLIKRAKISYFIVPLVFRKLNGQKVQMMLVRYLLSEIYILVYPCTGCGTSKI